MTLVWNHYYQPVLYKFHYHFYTYLLAFRARRSCLISCTHLFILFTVEWVWDSQFSQGSVSQFRHSVMSDSLQSHGLQHTRLPCPSPTPWVYSNSCPLSRRFHPTISSLVVPFSSCPQSFPASGSFPMSQFFASGGQSIGVSASAISPSNEYSGLISFRMDWLDLHAVQGTLKSLLQHHSSKSISSSTLSFLYGPALTSIHHYWKNQSFD